MTRAATVEDIPAIVMLALAFSEAEYREFVVSTPEALAEVARLIIAGPMTAGCIHEQDGVIVGMIGMMASTNPFSGEIVASEVAWWMTPKARGGSGAMRLLRWAEAWAREQGATRFQMIAPNDRVGAFYERLGFKRMEIHYQRRLA